ncbi:MAG: hypothetical protein JO201_02785 [Verrucomicrobia bacterium]|nr:hypothetical protein [Verrucomicrobiota bacterium]
MTQSLRIIPERINFAIPSSTLRNRLIEAKVPFSVSKPEDLGNEDIFAAVREATVLLLIKPKKPVEPPVATPLKQRPPTVKNVTVKAAMMTEPHGREVTTYTGDAPKLYAIFKTEGVTSGDKIRAVWIADDVGEAAPPKTKIDEKTLTLDGDTEDGVFSLSKPTKGWPLGKYHLEIFVNGELAAKVNFAIKAPPQSKKHADDEEESGED